MSYDFYIKKVIEFEENINAITGKILQIEIEANTQRKNQLRNELADLTNTFWSTINNSVFSAHVKYKIMHSLISAQPPVKENLKTLYQTETIQARHPFPTKCNPIDVAQYPLYTLFLQFKFKLAKPYISRDDETFYICENPIRKDKVSKIPMVSSSTWKGNMRFAASMVQPDAPDSVTMSRLFGNDKAASSNFNQGRLWFYDTFFKKIILEVINPHDRKTKAGTNPITIEAVPSGEEGYFSLLYCPFDLMGNHDAQIVKNEVSGDLSLLSEALKLMMLEYGFSAKKTTGYGIIRPSVREVIIRMNGLLPNQPSTAEVLLDNLIQELKRLADQIREN